jgi:hypothetical protein
MWLHSLPELYFFFIYTNGYPKSKTREDNNQNEVKRIKYIAGNGAQIRIDSNLQ